MTPRYKAFAILSFAAAGAAFAAGQYDQPYAIVAAERSPSADPHLRGNVIINRIDDETVISGGRPGSYGNYYPITPGPHTITLDLPRRKGFHLATQNNLQIDAKPCVRYIVAAELKSTVEQEWTPIVRREERIGECEAKFHIAAGAK